MRKKLPAVRSVGIDDFQHDNGDAYDEDTEYGLEDSLYRDLETGEGFARGQVLQAEAVDCTEESLAADGQVTVEADDQNLFETHDGVLEKCGNLIKVDGKLFDVLGKTCHINSERVLQANHNRLCCWNCTLTFPWAGMGCVDHYDHRRNTFYLFGYFCSFNCSKRFLLERNGLKDHQRSEALALLYRRFRKVAIAEGRVPPPVVLSASPSKYTLEKFGGCMSASQYRESIGVFDVHITRKVDAIFLTNDKPILQAEKPVTSVPVTTKQTEHGSDGTQAKPAKAVTAKKSTGAVEVNKRGRTKRTREDSDAANLAKTVDEPPVRKMPNFGEVFDQARARTNNYGGAGAKNAFRLKRKKEVHEATKKGGTLDSFMNITSKKAS